MDCSSAEGSTFVLHGMHSARREAAPFAPLKRAEVSGGRAGGQVDSDKTFAVQVALEDNVVDSTVSYVQCALLYTNSNGERRIRCRLPSLSHPPPPPL